jgi:hypothetical protein
MTLRGPRGDLSAATAPAGTQTPCAFRKESIHSWPLSSRVVLAGLVAPPAATASTTLAAVVSSGASKITSTSYSPNE